MFLDYGMDSFYIHRYLPNKNVQSSPENNCICHEDMFHKYIDWNYLMMKSNKFDLRFELYHIIHSLDNNNDIHELNFHMLHLIDMGMMHNNLLLVFDINDRNNLLDKHNGNFYYRLYEYKFLDFHMDYFDMDRLESHKNVLRILNKR